MLPGDGPPEPRLQPEVRKRRRGRCHPAGWDGRKRGRGAQGEEAKLGRTHELRAPQPRSAEVSSTGARGTVASAIVAGPAAAGYKNDRSRGLRSQLGRRPGPRARGLAQVAAAARSTQAAALPPRSLFAARLLPRWLRVRAAGCGLRAARLARARRRRARGPRGRRARELGRRRPAEVRAIKGGAGRRGGRSRRGGWGASSGSPRPPRRRARAPLAWGGAAQSGRWPRPRPAPSPGSPLPAAAAPAPGPAASEAVEREMRATTAPPRAWAEPSAGGAWAQPGDGGEPQPPPASEP